MRKYICSTLPSLHAGGDSLFAVACRLRELDVSEDFGSDLLRGLAGLEVGETYVDEDGDTWERVE